MARTLATTRRSKGIDADLRGRVLAALEALDEPYRTALVALLDDLPPTAIAARLGRRTRPCAPLNRLPSSPTGSAGRCCPQGSGLGSGSIQRASSTDTLFASVFVQATSSFRVSVMLS